MIPTEFSFVSCFKCERMRFKIITTVKYCAISCCGFEILCLLEQLYILVSKIYHFIRFVSNGKLAALLLIFSLPTNVFCFVYMAEKLIKIETHEVNDPKTTELL